MNRTIWKRGCSLLFTLVLVIGLMPVTALAAENTAPTVEEFTTVEQLRTAFDMNDSTADKTFKKVYFGNKNQQWSIVGVDPVGEGLVLLFQSYMPWSYFSSSLALKDYDPTWGIEYEGEFVPEKVAPNNYGASDMRETFQSYTDPNSDACLFTDAQLKLIIPTTIYTADVYNTDGSGNPRVYHSTELLYPTYSTDYKSASDGRIQFVTVGSNSAEDLGTELKVSLGPNVSSSFTRSPNGRNIDNKTHVLSNSSSGVNTYAANYNKASYLPVFQLDTSNVLFGSIYEGIAQEGKQTVSPYTQLFTLRMDAEEYDVDLGTANITAPALEYVTVKDAPEGTFLVVQCGKGAWAKAVSGDMTFSAYDISSGDITSFENCKVWLEKTDSDAKLTYAAMATTAEAYSVNVTGNAKLMRDEKSGEENQVSLDSAPITDIVYTTVEDYCFPADYCNVLSGNGITVTRNSDTQITISGTPTADVNLTLPMPDYCGTKDWWDGTTVASSYESGTGTEDDPYVIASAEQFAYFAQQMKGEDYNGAGEYFVLTADLELTAANWTPIFRFDGSFDGNGHTIVYTQQEGRYSTNDVNQRFYYFGLFGIQRGTVSNLNVSGDILVSVPTPTDFRLADVNVGGICGYTRGTVTHCYSDVEIRFAEGMSSTPNVGGIAGQVDNDREDPGVVECCGYTGSISGNVSGAKAGGIAGHMRGGTIRQCFNKGTIDLTVNGAYAGGIIGSIYDMNYTKTRVIESCYNWGDISVKATTSGTASVGGIGGNLSAEEGNGANYYPPSTIRGCYSTGELASSADTTSPLSPLVSGHVEVSHNYCLEGGDENTTQVADKEALFEALNAFAANTWFTDTVTGDVRLLWELKVNPTPEAVFNADSENGGVLSNVTAGMMYSLDDGATWIEIIDTTAAITGVTTENGIRVYWPGDFHETNDSAVQIIAITKAAAPSGVSGQNCTTSAQNNGKITGVDATMEYRLEDGDTWIAITGDTVTGLEPGTYLVRVKGSGTTLASDPVSVVIRRYVGPTTYPITVKDAENGTVTCYAHGAAKDAEVTLHVKADVGYQLASLTITDADGNTRAVTKVDEKTYTFVMPASAVTVEAVFTPTTVEPSDLPFTDVSTSDWFYGAVKFVYENGLMDGVGNNLFAPNATLNRAMAVTILYRLEGSPAVTTDAGFNDVAAGTWYTDAVNWAAANNIVNGVEGNNFDPTGSLTREQMATVLYRYAQYKGADVSASGDISGFVDSANVSSWAADAVKWAVGSGLVNGVEGNALAPQGTSTRAQAATVLMRFVG